LIFQSVRTDAEIIIHKDVLPELREFGFDKGWAFTPVGLDKVLSSQNVPPKLSKLVMTGEPISTDPYFRFSQNPNITELNIEDGIGRSGAIAEQVLVFYDSRVLMAMICVRNRF
jgi:hypothetical protein